VRPMKRSNETITELRLLGIPHYSQGEADGLCLYYAMSMMLAALHPEYQSQIHEPPRYKRMGSPVFQALRALVRREREFKNRVADWFFNGLRATEATRVLNRLFGDVTRPGLSGPTFIRRSKSTAPEAEVREAEAISVARVDCQARVRLA